MTQLLPPSRRDRLRSVVVLLGLLAMFAVVAAVVDRFDDEPVETSGEEEPSRLAADLRGEFLVSGSSTVFPIVQKQAEEFADLAPGVAIAVEGPGSGDGAKKFCAGEVPIANASRLYKDEELALCAEAGIDYIEIRRGIDGISVITSLDNDEVECVSFNDLYALISEDAQGFDTWSDANTITAEWAGTEFPAVALQVFGPGEESGTFDSFAEIVMEGVAKGETGLDTEAREYVTTIRPDYTSSPDDNVILEGVSASTYSIGWVGFAFAQEAAAAGRAAMLPVAFEDGGSCVTPSPETIASADFPISRFLYTYVNAAAADNDPSVAAFVDYMMSTEGLASVTAVGYIDLASPDQVLAQDVWANRVTGPVWE